MITCELCGHDNDETAPACTACGNDELRGSESAGKADPFAANVTVFRLLVVISIATYLVWFALSFLEPYLYPRDALDAFAWRGYGELIPLPPIVGWGFLALHFVCAVGLYRFSWPARLAYTALLLFGALLIPLGGISVGTAMEDMFGYCGLLADGATLAMAWTAPLKSRFQQL